ncbi:hypothetical protein D0A34_06245 [Microcoleus vaginatus PCC 9802]|uniref:hypothetical protein n=1 Tax=Microcoleus vaginatus TaxID=119532 RepID=UPI00020D171A|nr:hypothetical protein MicvaDRAFT_5306 [Microcoleus vaginatus FGP-2]UNU18526.1 hypothetical protein D0A34_06245 [Microcoleus vaginatus PCC 9802]
MSNGYYGPYQSRLLNFISKQSRQVADNCDRTWRHIKEATLTATQILLYPAYLLVQSSRLLGRQLRESSQKVDLPELQEFVGDENPDGQQNWYQGEISEESSIAEILHLAENLLNSSQTAKTLATFPLLINQGNTANNLHPAINFSGQITKHQTTSVLELPLAKTGLKPQPKVEGIASFIPARTLVLVGRENQILDILTPQQQELLEGRITWEVANCGPERREITQKELKFNLGLESAAKKAQLPPVRRFWELMAWLQTSPVALKRNQFGESILAVKKSIDRNSILVQKARAQIEAKTAQQSIAASNLIDHNTPKLETNFNSKFDRPPTPLSFVTLLDRAAVNLEEFTLPPSVKTIAAPPENSGVKIDTSGTETNLDFSARDILEKYARNIEQVIWSSVDHLLGKETAASNNTEKSVAIQYYLKQRQEQENPQNSPEVDRPWLNWQDLFGEAAPQHLIDESSEPQAAAQSSAKVKEKIAELGELAEGRSTAVSISPYPEALHSLLGQLKQSLLTKSSKSQPQTASDLSDLAVTQKNSSALAAESTPGRAPETQVPKNTNPNTAQNNQSPAAITAQTSRYTAATPPTAEPKNPSAGVLPEGEYLETKAESMGYIKHPLEQVLEWLDRVMLRLENIAEQLWNWAKINLPKILKSKDKID